MATKGTYTAYQSSRALTSNLGDIAIQAADRKIAGDERKRLEQERREAKQSAISESFSEDYNTLTDVITNNKSIDEAFARGIGGARDMMGDIYKQIQKNPSLANDVGVQLKIQNLTNFSKNLKSVSDRYTEHAGRVAEGIQNGTLSSWEDGQLNQVDSVFSKANLNVRPDSETGMPLGATIKVDEYGDPVLDEYGAKEVDNLNLVEILDGRGLGELVPVYEMSAEAQTIGPDLGKREIKKKDGSFSHNEYQVFSEIEPDVRNLVKGFIGDARQPSNIAKSIWSDVLGNEARELDEADMLEIEDAFTETIKAFYDEKASSTTDFSAQNAARKEANRKREAKATKKLEGVSKGFTVVTDQNENPVQREFDVEVNQNIHGKAQASFSLPTDAKTKKSELTVTGADGNKVVVNNIHLMESGELAYSGFKYQGKISGQELDPNSGDIFASGGSGKLSSNVVRKEVGGGEVENDPVLTAVAKAYGLDNEGQLKTMLQNKVDGFKPKEKTSIKLTPAQQAKVDEFKNKYLEN